MTKRDWGFILCETILCNGLVWLLGFEFDAKTKIIMANIVNLVICGLYVAIVLMGVE